MAILFAKANSNRAFCTKQYKELYSKLTKAQVTLQHNASSALIFDSYGPLHFFPLLPFWSSLQRLSDSI